MATPDDDDSGNMSTTKKPAPKPQGPDDENDTKNQSSQSIILFYKYHPLSSSLEVMEPYRTAMEALCLSLQLKGRILIGCSDNAEGINGTLAGQEKSVRAFTYALLGRQFVVNQTVVLDDAMKVALEEFWNESKAFAEIAGVPELTMDTPDDFKWSTSSGSLDELFPDLNVKLVAECISTGGVLSSISVDETAKGYLSPKEWHEAVSKMHAEDTVLIDCRNQKEAAIGGFPNAVNPHTTTFAQFPRWVHEHQHQLQDKRVLMYCTGGIRCEKASAYIRNEVPGVKSVNHLKGGVHKYLEEYGSEGLWKGKNFVFDGRGAVGAAETQMGKAWHVSDVAGAKISDEDVVGRCQYCQKPYDTFHPHAVCTVCREPTLICESCQSSVKEYHCLDHFYLRNCYFTDLEAFSESELAGQVEELKGHLAKIAVGRRYKQKRRTLQKQCDRIEKRLDDISGEQGAGDEMIGTTCCRNCGDADCEGHCWGFHGLHCKEKLERHELNETQDATKRSARRKANQRDSKVKKREQSIEEIMLLGLSLPPGDHRDERTGIRVPPPAVRVLRMPIKGKWNGKSLVCVIQQEFGELADDSVLDMVLREGLLGLNDEKVTRQTIGTTLRNMDAISRITHWHEPPVLVPPVIQVEQVTLSQSVQDEYGIDPAGACILVCNKPSSVPVYPTGPYLSNSLTLMVEAQEKLATRSLLTCHRIDRVTSGVTICTTNASVARLIQSKMSEGLIRKVYVARVKGRFPCSVDAAKLCFPSTSDLASWTWIEALGCFEVDAPIHTVDPMGGIRVISAEGKSAKSRFKSLVYDSDTDCSLITCCPLTGRGHQLRVHLQWLNFPIIGDSLYGGSTNCDSNQKGAALRLMTEMCSKDSGRRLPQISDSEVESAVRACRCCQDGSQGIENSFTSAQLLGEGHSICLHALRYEITVNKKRHAKHSSLAVLEMEVDMPDWAARFGEVAVPWLQEETNIPSAIGKADTPKTTQSHYEAHSASSYESAFFYSPGAYMNYLTDLVVSRLGWSGGPSDSRTLLDVGGGTGNFTRMIVNGRPSVKAVVVDPFLESSSNEGNDQQEQIRFVKAGAEGFATKSNAWWRQGYHQVLMKEVVHHLDTEDRLGIFQGIHNEIVPTSDPTNSPALLIVTRPQIDHDYPLWKEANQVWADNQPSLDDIRSDLVAAGFQRVEHAIQSYPCSTPLERWLDMVKSRFWSTFSNFTDDELQEACSRIERDEMRRLDEERNIHFEDRLLIISAFRE